MPEKRYRNKYTGTTVRTERNLGVAWEEVDEDAPLVLVAESGKVLDSKGDTVHPANQEEVRADATRDSKRRRSQPRKGADSE